MKTYRLTLKRKWFDLVKLGEKKFEYREIKPYWQHRMNNIKQCSHIEFVNGYHDDSEKIVVELLNVSIGKPMKGMIEDEFLDKSFYILTLGNLIN